MIAGFFHAQEPAMTHRRYSRSLRELAERKKRRSAPADRKEKGDAAATRP